MNWSVEYTDEFEEWWLTLSESEQDEIAATVMLLEEVGPSLAYPYSSNVKGSRHGAMRELRVQHAGDPYRILYAFDPRRCAILLLGGNKKGDDRWYETHVPTADRIYDDHLDTLKKEGFLP